MSRGPLILQPQLLHLLVVVLLLRPDLTGCTRPGEFVAGSFVLTQKSLNEAPYRYAGILRKALDKVETKDPPSQSDVEKCDVKYKIEPSGRRSKLHIIENTLSINLRDNNTVEIAAKVYVEVAAKTWIWKGINFGFLGCLKMNSCNGQIVTYSSNVDFVVAFQVFWDKDANRLSVNIKPVNTVLKDVMVQGCAPPWYLWWFQKWQTLLNEGVQDAFQEYANNYQHQTEVPEEFSPFKGVYIQYSITDLVWSKEFVIVQASASFSTELDGKNVTFVPNTTTERSPIPAEGWNMTSPTDRESHLLQGVRLSTEFLNSLMWYATVSNITKYHGQARIIDSVINGTISYTPPVILVQEHNLLSINIKHGLLLATCKPTAANDDVLPATLFKAEFFGLQGSGKIRLASTKEQTGIRVSLESMDLSKLNTKPFEPKLPLPESFENELMKSAISQLQPVVNNYLKSKPLYLPESVTPFAASPQLHLWSTGNGTGYAEMLSYCTCSKSKLSLFAECDARSHICDGEQVHDDDQRAAEETTTVAASKVNIAHELGDAMKKGIKNIFAVASGVIQANRSQEREMPSHEETFGTFNFSSLFEGSKGNLSYVGFHITIFEEDDRCSLEELGSSAKVYWVWRTFRCTALYLSKRSMNQYYYLDANNFRFGCSDDQCKFCQLQNLSTNTADPQCHQIPSTRQSYQIEQQNIQRWASDNGSSESVIANVFFSEEFCTFHPRYVEPQLVSTHTYVGSTRENEACVETDKNDFISLVLGDNRTIVQADWECTTDCFGCMFRVRNVDMESCFQNRPGVRIIFTNSAYVKTAVARKESMESSDSAIYIGVSCSVMLTVLIILVGIMWNKRSKETAAAVAASQNLSAGSTKKLTSSSSPDGSQNWVSRKYGSAKDLMSRHLGIRFLTWKGKEGKEIREDIIQNCMLLINCALAIVFATAWNSENNPLLIIHTKFHSGLTVSIDIFETSLVASFANRLNLLTCLVNLVNATVVLGTVLAWCVTKTGARSGWMKARLISSVSLLAGIFLVIAALIFTTYFDDLVVLKRGKGYFFTDNDAMYGMVTKAMKVSLNGLSLTVLSFTIVFLFHGVGGGLYCGTVVFRMLHLHSKRSNMEILTTLLVILTIIQPFICLHPVIIWSQDSNRNSTFLIMVILIWFLPLGVHILIKAFISHCRPRCKSKIDPDPSLEEDLTQSMRSRKNGNQRSEEQEKCNRRRKAYMTVVDMIVQVMQLAFFLTGFSLITHYIVNTEFNQDRKNLQNFVLPAIISVFFWMMSISYLLLSLVLDETRQESRLVFKDQDLEVARNMLRNSLRRRLATMDSSSRVRTLQRQRDLGLLELPDATSEAASITVPNKRRTLPANIDLSESMRGRTVLPADSSRVMVKSFQAAADHSTSSSSIGGAAKSRRPAAATGGVRDKIGRFEDIKMQPVIHKRTKATAAQKYISQAVPEEGEEEDEVELRRQHPRLEEVEEDAGTTTTTIVGEGGGSGCWWRTKRLWHFLLESQEYRDPLTYGWRIKFRRLFLTFGVTLFTFLTTYTTYTTQSFSSKAEIQKLLDLAGTNLTWPDSGSVLDDVFGLYNSMQRAKSYIMIGSTLLFWASLACDFASHFTPSESRKMLFFTGSRVTNFCGSLAVFAGVIIVGLPDYLDASHLDEICPFCGDNFNAYVKQIAEFSIGLFFACLFTFQLIPILVTIVPALVRASVLILIHPSLQIEENSVTSLRMTILQQVIQFSSLLTFPITFISMAILQQYQKDSAVTLLIIAFWTFPPFVLFLGLHYTRKFRRYTILLYVYYLYNVCYFALLVALLFYSLTLQRILHFLEDMMKEPTFWAGSIAQVFLCNVVISDMLYMTVF